MYGGAAEGTGYSVTSVTGVRVCLELRQQGNLMNRKLGDAVCTSVVEEKGFGDRVALRYITVGDSFQYSP